MNAICERLIGTLRRELLDRTIILSNAHLRTVLANYQEHYNTARPHQGIGQRVPDNDPAPHAGQGRPAVTTHEPGGTRRQSAGTAAGGATRPAMHELRPGRTAGQLRRVE
jgi:hypothetical protein